MVDSTTNRPFAIRIPDADLADLRQRLSQTRWPEALVGDWSDGTDLAFLRDLIGYWRETFDWRAAEARLNAFPQFLVPVGGQSVHVLHVRGNGPAPLPLVVSHGWPGSVAEMLDLIPRLTDPGRFGGDPRDAFDVVVPSLPGFGFSDRPTAPGTTPLRIAQMWADIMTQLGYRRFGAHGGDWGSAISTYLGITEPQRTIGVHVTFVMRGFVPPLDVIGSTAEPDELEYFDRIDRWYASEAGYSHLQATKPQTLAYGLMDSPAGLAAYIVEKFRTWSDCGGSIERVFSHDTLLTNIAIYWFTRTIGSSMHLYWERQRAPIEAPRAPLPVPFALAAFPKEIPLPPRRLLERVFKIERYTPMPRGGHFPALEQPDMLAADIAAFFRPLR